MEHEGDAFGLSPESRVSAAGADPAPHSMLHDFADHVVAFSREAEEVVASRPLGAAAAAFLLGIAVGRTIGAFKP